MKFSIKDFFSKCETADLVTFTEKILHGKLHFLCNENRQVHFFFYQTVAFTQYVPQEIFSVFP